MCGTQASRGCSALLQVMLESPFPVLIIYYPSNSTSSPMPFKNKFTSPLIRSPISSGNVRLTATVSITRSLTPTTSRCCWSGLAPTPTVARKAQICTSSAAATAVLAGKM